MKLLFSKMNFVALVMCFIAVQVNAQTKNKVKQIALNDSTYDIEFVAKPYQNEKFYLACYYGLSNSMVDSCVVNNKSIGHFKGNKKLVGGIYLVVTKGYASMFDLLIGDEQHFTINVDTTLHQPPVITGSKDNALFKEYTQHRSEIEKNVIALADNLKTAKTSKDSAKINADIKAKKLEFVKYRNDFIEANKTTLVAALLAADKVPDAPEIPIDPITKKGDSTYPYRFVKEHYWDDVDFADNRLLRTPFFEKKIDNYFKYYISPNADSIIPEVKYMLLSARESKEMYPYLLIKFTNKYLKPEYMGQEKVFVNIGLDFYLKGDTVYLDQKSRKTIIDRIYFLISNTLGSPAPSLDLTDTTGKIVSLYSVKSKYTFIAYWSPTCGHCQQEIPVLDSFYRAKWKDLGITVYSILSDEKLMPDLKKFIKDKKLPTDWLYTYETKEAAAAVAKSGQMSFQQAYDFIQTPVFYMLDADKKIIGKNLSLHQFDSLIDQYKGRP